MPDECQAASTSPELLGDLAGNSFCAFAIASLLISMFLTFARAEEHKGTLSSGPARDTTMREEAVESLLEEVAGEYSFSDDALLLLGDI